MKKKFITLFAILLVVISAAARGPGSEAYICEVMPEKLPQGCAYIDMLIPIGEKDENYTENNAENCRKNGILNQSEIVAYNEDGFQSYTFHIKTARSRIFPYEDASGVLCVVFLADEDGYDTGTAQGINKFGRKYEKAKFAYLDADGKVLSVTNEIDIRNDEGYMDIYITLSGKEAVCEMAGIRSNGIENYVKLFIGTMIIVFLCFFIAKVKRI